MKLLKSPDLHPLEAHLMPEYAMCAPRQTGLRPLPPTGLATVARCWNSTRCDLGWQLWPVPGDI